MLWISVWWKKKKTGEKSIYCEKGKVCKENMQKYKEIALQISKTRYNIFIGSNPFDSDKRAHLFAPYSVIESHICFSIM